MIWLNNNSKTRTPLDKEIGTLKIFKRVFPTFLVWKERLKTFGVDESLFIEADFNFLNVLIGNSYLKYSTADKIYGYAAMNLQVLKAEQKRQEGVYNLKLDKFFKFDDVITNIIKDTFDGSITGNNVNTGYNLGNVKEENVKEGNQTDISPDFIDEKNKTTITNTLDNVRDIINTTTRKTTLSLAKNLMSLDYFMNLKYPKITFIVKMAQALKHPYQPNIESENI